MAFTSSWSCFRTWNTSGILLLPSSDLLNLLDCDPATRVPWRQTARPRMAVSHGSGGRAEQGGDPVGAEELAGVPAGLRPVRGQEVQPRASARGGSCQR